MYTNIFKKFEFFRFWPSIYRLVHHKLCSEVAEKRSGNSQKYLQLDLKI